MLDDDHNQQDERQRVREIPVIHEGPRMHQHQCQHPRTIPQSGFGFGYVPVSQPSSGYQHAAQQQRVNRQKASSPKQPSAKLPKTSQQAKTPSKERIVPIQVVHQQEPQNNVTKLSSPSSQPKQTNGEDKEVSKLIETESNKKPSPTVPKNNSAPKKDGTMDEGEDHRVIAARKKLISILENLETIENEVIAFSGSSDDKLYTKLEEQLMAKLLRLDEVNANGSPKEELIRSERKATVKRIQQTLDLLELKCTSTS